MTELPQAPPLVHSPGAARRSSSGAAAGVAAAAVAALLATGCITATSPEIASMKDSIESAVDGDFEREVGIRLGRVSIGLGKTILGMVARHDEDDDLDDVTALLRGLRKVEVSVYQTGSFAASDLTQVPARVESAMARGHWVAAVRVRSDEELAWVFCRMDPQEKLRGVTVVTLDGEQLTLVRLAGRLDRALAAAISLARDSASDQRDRGFEIDELPEPAELETVARSAADESASTS